MINEICTVCRKKHDVLLPQWWSLVNYYDLTGIFCYTCFEKVRHKNARPLHPIAYRNALRKMDGSAPIKARSKTEYKRLVAQGANVVPPTLSNGDGVGSDYNSQEMNNGQRAYC